MNPKIADRVLEIGIQLSAEHDYGTLLTKIVDCAMEITNCDGGTLYMYNDGVLRFCVTKNKSLNIEQGLKDDEFYPAVKMKDENICAYSAIHKKMLNIEDAYKSDEFDFSGPRNYDKLTKYRTKSILVVPLVNNEDRLIGVIQLINAIDENGEIIPFSKEFEMIIASLASQMAIALSNMKYVQEIEELMFSITQSFTDAIDKRNPYNYNHSRNVLLYTKMLVNYINELHENGKCEKYFDLYNKRELELAALMHDIGKIVVPREIMNKSTRLGSKLEITLLRFDYLKSLYKIDYLSNKITEEDWLKIEAELTEIKQQVKEINKKNFLEKEKISYINNIAKKYYENSDGEIISYLTPDEEECLSVPKGNLTEEEREIINSHVIYTEKYLNNMTLGKRFSCIGKWAGAHHELLDGSGYPRGLKGDEIAFESRILTVVDIYEALTASDRPYKKAVDKEKAFDILYKMADEGKIDKEILSLFEAAIKLNSKDLEKGCLSKEVKT